MSSFFREFFKFFPFKKDKNEIYAEKIHAKSTHNAEFKLPLNLKPTQTHYVVVSGKYHQAQKQRHTAVA